MIAVGKNEPDSQQQIAAMAAKGQLRLVWNAQRKVIQVLASKRSTSAPAPQECDGPDAA